MLEQFFRILGYGLCHQLPGRSFAAGGFQLPVCARDTGIYIGFAVSLLVLHLMTHRTRPSDLPRWPVLVLIGAFVASMAVDGVTSYGGFRETTNDLRLITGLLTGWGLAAILLPMVNTQIWAEHGKGRVIEGGGQLAVWLGAMVLTFLATRWFMPLVGVVYPLLLAIAILVTFGAVNLVLVGLIPRFERSARRCADLWPMLVIALVFTVAELAATAWLKSFVQGLVR